MIYNAGRLNKKVYFIGKVKTKNSYGFDTFTDGILFSTFASIQPVRGKEYYEMQKLRDDESIKITIRYRTDVTHDMKIKYHNHVYDIQSIVNPDMQNESLELYCTENTRGATSGHNQV